MNKYIKMILVNVFIVGIGVSLVYGVNFFYGDKASESMQKAPEFIGIDSNGNRHRLSDYQGKTVVLEWKNHLCPFVKKHYAQGHMQALQKKWTDQGVVWFSVISSAPNKQGHVSAQECNTIVRDEQSFASAVLLDSDGDIGHVYHAKTTPHMFVIDAKGYIVYQGAIDSIRSTDSSDIKDAVNFVDVALASLMDKKPIETYQTPPYGCSIKY